MCHCRSKCTRQPLFVVGRWKLKNQYFVVVQAICGSYICISVLRLFPGILQSFYPHYFPSFISQLSIIRYYFGYLAWVDFGIVKLIRNSRHRIKSWKCNFPLTFNSLCNYGDFHYKNEITSVIRDRRDYNGVHVWIYVLRKIWKQTLHVKLYLHLTKQ